MDMQRQLDQLLSREPRAAWGVVVRDEHGDVVAAHDGSRVLGTASIGKIFLLLETARRFELDPGLRSKLLSRSSGEAVGESGLWQHLDVPALPMCDVAVLVAAVSDNWATNVLLEEVGFPAVEAMQDELGVTASGLRDRVRDGRASDDPPHLSEGSAEELSLVVARIRDETANSPAVSSQVRRWMALNADLSMVAVSWHLDPLSHYVESVPALVNKTGADEGVRADIGVLTGQTHALAYAVIANWDASLPGSDSVAESVYDSMAAIGAYLLALATNSSVKDAGVMP